MLNGARSPGLVSGPQPVYRGHAELRDWWKAVKEPWAYFKSHIERAVHGDNRVVTAVRFDAFGKASGVKVEWSTANAWEVEEGLIASFAGYPSLD